MNIKKVPCFRLNVPNGGMQGPQLIIPNDQAAEKILIKSNIKMLLELFIVALSVPLFKY